jgi:hypothetical protein
MITQSLKQNVRL